MINVKLRNKYPNPNIGLRQQDLLHDNAHFPIVADLQEKVKGGEKEVQKMGEWRNMRKLGGLSGVGVVEDEGGAQR